MYLYKTWLTKVRLVKGNLVQGQYSPFPFYVSRDKLVKDNFKIINWGKFVKKFNIIHMGELVKKV